MNKPPVNWGGIAGEFVVIVTGVLVAPAVDSCYRDRQDRAAEVDYLRRFLADVQNLGLITDAGLRTRILDCHRNAARRTRRIEHRVTGCGELMT